MSFIFEPHPPFPREEPCIFLAFGLRLCIMRRLMDMLLFLQDATAGAAGAAQQQPSGADSMLRMLPMFGMIFVVMYFLMIRPQNKQRKEREAMMAGLKKNDHVLTNAGFYGVIK